MCFQVPSPVNLQQNLTCEWKKTCSLLLLAPGLPQTNLLLAPAKTAKDRVHGPKGATRSSASTPGRIEKIFICMSSQYAW